MEDTRSKRGMVLKLLLPLVFVLPLFFQGVPLTIKSSLLSLAVLFLGVFGSSIGLVRLKESRMLVRLKILPISHQRLLGHFLLANVATDLLQLFIPTMIVLYLGDGDAYASGIVMICVVSGVFAANSLGLMIASIAGSSAEIHLYSAIVVLVLGAVSGLFMSVPPNMQSFASLSPFYHLSASVQIILGNGAMDVWVLAPIGGAVLFLIALAASSTAFNRP